MKTYRQLVTGASVEVENPFEWLPVTAERIWHLVAYQYQSAASNTQASELVKYLDPLPRQLILDRAPQR